MQSKTSPRRESKCPWGNRESLKVDHCPISQVRGSLGSAEAPRSELRRRTWGGHHSYFSSVCFWLPQVSVAAWRHSLPAVTGLLSGLGAAPRWEHGALGVRPHSWGARLSCSQALGIFLSQGSNPCPRRRHMDSQTWYHQGSPWSCVLSWFCMPLMLIFTSSALAAIFLLFDIVYRLLSIVYR